MKLHYIWIKEYGPFKNQGVCLSDRYIIDLKVDIKQNDKIKGILEIKENPSYIENFFGVPNVENVSAIIGKNGSGKSSILNYIKSHFPKGLEANLKSDLVIYTFSGNDGVTNFINYPSTWELSIIDESGLFNRREYSNFPESTDTFFFNSNIGDADYIYYSYFLSQNFESISWSGLKDLSTSSLIAQSRISYNESMQNHNAQSQVSDFDLYEADEVGRAIQLLNSSYKNILPFKPPESLFIKIDNSDNIFFTSESSNHPKIGRLIEKLITANNAENGKIKILNNISIAVMVNLLLTEKKFASSMEVEHNYLFSRGQSVADFLSTFFEKLKTAKVKTYDTYSNNYDRYIQLSVLIPEFIKYISELLDKQILTVDNSQNPQFFYLPINNESQKSFSKFIEYYVHIKGFTNFLTFRWRNLSTGEQSFLSLFARFYDFKFHSIGKDDIKKNLVILIDEGDAGYHPEWQRKYFATLLDVLSKIFENHKLQLIFTANAPFLTSDLPKNCIIFIEKIKNNVIIIHSKDNNRQETFGSNIHSLFSDSFYMEGALIGEFAKSKIDTIIQYLNNSSNVKQPNISYRKTIELIGEPILKRKLQLMWNEKFGLDEELKQLNKRILEIREIQAKRSPNK